MNYNETKKKQCSNRDFSKIYSSYEWLWDQRINQRKSIDDIAKLSDYSRATTYRKLKDFDMIKFKPIRKPKNHIVLSSDCIDFINGLLLGDGTLRCRHKYNIKKNISASYSQGCKHKEYLDFVQKKMMMFGIDGNITSYDNFDIRTNRYSTYYTYRSKFYDALLELYNEWYTNFYFCPLCEKKYLYKNYKQHDKCTECGCDIQRKIIPKNLKLTRNVVMQWYLGDGCLSQRLIMKKYLSYRCILYTCGFLQSDVKILIKKLNDIGIESYYRKNIIWIGKKRYIKKFFEYIGRCNVDCYQYKFPNSITELNYKR